VLSSSGGLPPWLTLSIFFSQHDAGTRVVTGAGGKLKADAVGF